jgi:uncharacterized protein YjdB
MNHRTIVRLSGVLLAAAVLGCNDYTSGVTPPSTFVVTPLTTLIDEGTQLQLTATLDGAPASVTWTSENTNIATVDANGLVTGKAGGGPIAITAALKSDPTKLRSANLTVAALVGTGLTNGVGVTAASTGARGTALIYRIFVPTGKTSLTITFKGGTGDGDIYVQRQTPPSDTQFTCASENAANNETCVIANPASGTWYIRVQVWDPFAGATLTATYAP